MVQHADIDHTGLTGISSGAVATDTIWDAAGDLAVGSGANTAAKLTLGAAKTVLSSNGSAAAWAAPASNMWKMSNAGSSQTLTNGTDTQLTFDSADIDGGGSVIDLANDRWVIPATGFYMVYVTWLWETTPPVDSAAISVRIGGTDSASRCRIHGNTSIAAQGLNGNFPLSCTSGDFVTVAINPGAATGVTARGNASVQIRTSATLVRVT
jgi:hypothetical protein